MEGNTNTNNNDAVDNELDLNDPEIQRMIEEQKYIEEQIRLENSMKTSNNNQQNNNQIPNQNQNPNLNPNLQLWQRFSQQQQMMLQQQQQQQQGEDNDQNQENNNEEGNNEMELIRVPQQIYVQAVNDLLFWTYFLVFAQVCKLIVPWFLITSGCMQGDTGFDYVDVTNYTGIGFAIQAFIALPYYLYIIKSIKNKEKMLDIAELLNKVDYYQQNEQIPDQNYMRYETAKISALQYQIKDKMSEQKAFFRVIGVLQFLLATGLMISGFVAICSKYQVWDQIFLTNVHSNCNTPMQVYIMAVVILVLIQYHTFYFLILAALIILPILLIQWLIKSCVQKKKKKNLLKHLKVIKYKKGILQEESECTICMGNFDEGDKIIIFPCQGQHPYHSFCIKAWLKAQSTCPNCRFDLNDLEKDNSVNDIEDQQEENQNQQPLLVQQD